jgi:hypothetical protein
MAAMAWTANRAYSKLSRDRAPGPVMRPPQTSKLHPLITRDMKPQATPPGPRALAVRAVAPSKAGTGLT